jgi:hypothetical protein
MNVTAEEAEKMISTATRVEATALWYQFYQQATCFQNASDRELLKWYNVLGNWKALGFSDEQGKQLKETGVTERLEQVQKRIDTWEGRSRNILKFLQSNRSGERAVHLESYLTHHYQSTVKDNWAGISKTLHAFENIREAVRALNTAMIHRLVRKANGFIPEPVRDDMHEIDAFIQQYNSSGSWDDLKEFDEELLAKHQLGFHPSGILISGPKRLDYFPEYQDEASEETETIPVVSSAKSRDGGDPKTLPPADVGSRPQSENFPDVPKNAPETIVGACLRAIEAPISIHPFPEIDFDRYINPPIVEQGINSVITLDPVEEKNSGEEPTATMRETAEQTSVEHSVQIVQTLIEARMEPEAPMIEPIPLARLRSSPKDSGIPVAAKVQALPLDIVETVPKEKEPVEIEQPLSASDERKDRKRKGGRHSTYSGPKSKKAKQGIVIDLNECPEKETCGMSGSWKQLLGNWGQIESVEKGAVVAEVPDTYVRGDPFPCDFHIQQLESMLSLKPTGGGTEFCRIIGLIKSHVRGAQTRLEPGRLSSLWLAPSFQGYILNSAPIQRIRKRATNVERYIPPPLEADRSAPTIIIEAGVDTSMPFLRNLFIFWLNGPAGKDLTSLLVLEIEMFYRRLRSTVGSNGRLLNSAFSMAAQAISSDPMVWRHFAQLLNTKNLASFPLPARYYPKGETSSVFYEADTLGGDSGPSYLAEYVLSGEVVNIQYLAPSPLVTKFIAKITNSSRTTYVDLTSDERAEELSSFILKNKLCWKALETPPHSIYFYPTGTIISHSFKLKEPRISIPISFVRITERDGKQECAGLPYEALTQAHLDRKAPATNRFGGQEELIKHANWDPELRDAGTLFDMLRCRKRFTHPIVQRSLETWSDYNFGTSLSTNSYYGSWAKQLREDVKKELQSWQQYEMDTYGNNKSFYFKLRNPQALEAPPAPEIIEISDDEDDIEIFLPEDSSDVFKRMMRTNRQSGGEVSDALYKEKLTKEARRKPDPEIATDPMAVDEPEATEPELTKVPGLGDYAFGATLEKPQYLGSPNRFRSRYRVRTGRNDQGRTG